MNSTRHTAAGTFRRGVVYGIDPSRHAAIKAIRPHLEPGGAMVEVSAEEAKALGLATVLLQAPEGVPQATETPAAEAETETETETETKAKAGAKK